MSRDMPMLFIFFKDEAEKIFKDGDEAEKSNYRPISVLPVISMLFQKSVSNQLYLFMNDNGHFSSGQSGFLLHHSAVTCLLKHTDNW